jgi:ATP-dependent protease HslVU (ClpYQ) peptidase subunit
VTCIVGLVEGDKVWIGGDSAGLAGWDLTVRKDPKVFRNGEFVMGFTSSYRMGQLLAHAFTPPPIEGDLHAYMVTKFVDAVRDCLKAGGYAKKENDAEAGGTFLVGVRGRLFNIGNDYQVGEPMDGYAAVGCGDQIAVGAVYGAQSDGQRNFIMNLPPRPAEAIVRIALEAAERFSGGVRGPFVVISTQAD